MAAQGMLWIVLAACGVANSIAGAAAEAKSARHAPEFITHSISDGVWHWAAEQVFATDTPKPGGFMAGLASNGPKADCGPRAAADAAQEPVSDHILGTVDLKPAPVTNLRPSTQAHGPLSAVGCGGVAECRAASAAGILARALSRRGARRALKATVAAVATWAATRGLLLLEPAARSPAVVAFGEAAPREAASAPPSAGVDSELGSAPEAPDWSEHLPTIGLRVLGVAVILAGVWRRRAATAPGLRRRPKVVSTVTPVSSGVSSPRSSGSVADAAALATPVETPLQTPRSKGEDHGDSADDLAPAQIAIKNVLLRWGLEAYTSAVLATTLEGGRSQDAMIAELRRAYWAKQSGNVSEAGNSGKERDVMITELLRAGWASQPSTVAESSANGKGDERDLERNDAADGLAARACALGARSAEQVLGAAKTDEESGRGGRPSTPRRARGAEERQVSLPTAAGETSTGGKVHVPKEADAADSLPSPPSVPQEKVLEKVGTADGPLSRPSTPQESGAPLEQQEKAQKKVDTALGTPSRPSTPQGASIVQRERTPKAGTAGELQEAMQRVNLRKVNSADGWLSRQSTPGDDGAVQREQREHDVEVAPKARRNFSRPSAAAESASVLEKVRYFEKVGKVDDQDGKPSAAGEAGGSEKPHNFPEGDSSSRSRSRSSQPGDAKDARSSEPVRDFPKTDEASQPSADAEPSADRREDSTEPAKAEDEAQVVFCTPGPAGKAGKARVKHKHGRSGSGTAKSTAGQPSSAREAYVERLRGNSRADGMVRQSSSARKAHAKEEEEVEEAEDGVDLAECMGPPSSAGEAYVEFEQALQDHESEQESPKKESLLTTPDGLRSLSTCSGGRGRCPSLSSVGSACEQYSICSGDSDTPETGSEADAEDPFVSFEARFGLKESPDCQRFSIHSDSDSEADVESSEDGPEDEEDETAWRPGEEA